MSDKLGDVLPSDQAAMLTDNARNLDQEGLSQIMSQSGSDHHNLSQEDINSLTKVATMRINNGDTMFGYDNMNINADNDDDGPNQNW